MPTHEKIALQRDKAKLTMDRLATRLRKIDPVMFNGWKSSTISLIESNQRKVKTTELRGLALALGCRVADLVDEVDD